MATVTQLYEIVNSLAEQAVGLKNLTATDASFISVGNTVLSSDSNIDAWHKVLADRIAKTAIAVNEYKADDAGLKKEGIEWGIALQRIYIDLFDSTENTTWKDADAEHSDPFRKSPATVTQKIFTDMTAWSFDATIPDVQLKTAFLGADKMAAFISAIHVALQNSIELSYENVSNTCRAAFIARSLAHGVNLIDVYKEMTGKTVTVDTALSDREFLRVASYTINRYVERMSRLSTLFNVDGRKTHTTSDRLAVTIHGDFASSASFFLESETYYRDLVKLPNYRTVPYWQGTGTSYDFADTSTINIKLKKSSGTGYDNYSKSGIVCLMNDIDAMGTTINNRRIKTVRNEADEYTTYFAKAEVGYFNDMAYNGVVFYLEDLPTAPVTPPTS